MTNMKIKVKGEESEQYSTISLPTDASLLPVKRLLKVMIHKLDFPTQKPDGCPIVYKLYHEQTRKTLSDDQTLKDAGVVENDTFEILIASESGDIAKDAVSKQRAKKDDESNEKPDVRLRWARTTKIISIFLGLLLLFFLMKYVIKTNHPQEKDLRAQVVSKVWQFSHGDGSVIAERIRLLSDGKIEGYYHPNESRWDLEDDIVVFYHESGEPSCRFTSLHTEHGKTVLSGPLLFDPQVIHVLKEVQSD